MTGEWLTRFDQKFTSTEYFYVDDKQHVSVDMMLGAKYPLSIFTHVELDAQVPTFYLKKCICLKALLTFVSEAIEISTSCECRLLDSPLKVTEVFWW